MRTLYTNASLYGHSARHFSVVSGTFDAFYTEIPTESFDEVIDLKGQTVLPGFNDSHGHFLGLRYIARQVSLADAKTLDDVKTLFQGKKTLIRASLFNENTFETGELLDRTTLDQFRDDIPVLVLRVCGHILMANS